MYKLVRKLIIAGLFVALGVVIADSNVVMIIKDFVEQFLNNF